MGLTRIRAQQISDIDYKQAVRVITLTDITLSGGAPVEVDGVTLIAGDRILVNGQSNAAQNGLYQVQTLGTGSNGTWVRTSDANQDGEIQPGMVVMVTQGNVYADTPWKLITNGVIIIGTTELIFEENYSLAFGNVFANGTAVIANVVSAPITLSTGNNITITGNNTTKTVTFATTNDISAGNLSTEFQGRVLFYDSDNSNYVGFRANGTVTSDIVWTLPATDGSPGQVLATNGSGLLTWTTGGGGGGGGLTWTTQANTPPVIANPGDFWYDSFSDIKYQYTNDGTSNVWIDQSFPTTFASISTGQIVNANANGIGNIGSAGTYFGNIFVATVSTGQVDASGNITGGNLISQGSVSLSSIIKTGSNGVGNIGSATNSFNIIFARATSAQYADLAERYQADQDYGPGTVVVFGGSREITQSTQSHDPRVAGIISTDPAFVMNAGSTGLLVALTGRVPCRVQGPVAKGDLLVTGHAPGTAERLQTWIPGCVIGKSLCDLDSDELATIEVAVGRF